MNYLIASVLFFVSGIALAQESFLGMSEDKATTIIAWIIAVQALCFGLGKGLTELAALTENKYDNMAANGLTKVAWFLGTMISKFGWSMPRQVVLKEADKINAKKPESKA